MTKTNAIRAYDVAYNNNSDLVTIAKYLANADDKERNEYLNRNPNILKALQDSIKHYAYSN